MTYVLVTPARNEARFIELTIKSVIAQTDPPVKWVIVSDGSTDGTDDVVSKYAVEYKWIELVRMPERQERHFGGKVQAFNAGYAKIKALDFDIVGNLDADITFEKGYFSFLLSKFADDPQLGVGGTPFTEESHLYDYRFTSADHVSGACQLFRRQCFEGIGGYIPLRMGGEDLAAGLAARMMGWQTRTFTEMTCQHHRTTQTGKTLSYIAMFRSGYHDYLMGSHPVWQIARSIYQMAGKPLVAHGALLLAGYVWALVTRARAIVPRELVCFRRSEQMRRLRELLVRPVVVSRNK